MINDDLDLITHGGAGYGKIAFHIICNTSKSVQRINLNTHSMMMFYLNLLQLYLKPGDVVIRGIIALFTTLMLAIQLTGTIVPVPRTTYLTSLDVWMIACLTFVLAALAEYIIVQLFYRKVAIL